MKINYLDFLRNSIDYPLRQAFRWRRKGLRVKNESKENLFMHYSGEQRRLLSDEEKRLISTYAFQELHQNSTRRIYLQNLYYLSLFEEVFRQVNWEGSEAIRAADIGVSDWFYVPALFAFLQYWNNPAGREVQLSGYEADAFRVYEDFYSRYDYAMLYSRGLADVEYIPQSYKEQSESFDMAFQLFPFIFLADHIHWGLPANRFDPQKLLAAAWNSLRLGGLFLVVNQGEAEWQAQKEMFQRLGIAVTVSFPFSNSFYSYPIGRFVTTAIKQENGRI